MDVRKKLSDATSEVAEASSNSKSKQMGEHYKAEQAAKEEAVAVMNEARASWDPRTSTQWDYKTVVLTGGFMGRHKEELNRPAFEAHLDQLGASGYELCWVLLEQALHGEKDGHVLIFKRPIHTAA